MLYNLSMSDKNKKAVEIYNDIAEEYAAKFDPIESDEDLRFLNQFLQHIKPESSILDLGCGTGFSAGYFTKQGMKSEGVDLSSSMIAIAQRNYPDLKFYIADMTSFKPEHEFDAVWAGYSLFHFEQEFFEQTLKNIKTYLKPGGILGLVMQEGDGEIEAEQPFKPTEKIYIHLYTEDQLEAILTNHGFEVIDKGVKQAETYEVSFNKLLLIAKLS